MIKNKKIYLGALSLITLTLPMASVIACNDNSTNGNKVNSLFDQTSKVVKERISLLKNTHLSTLPFNNSIFVSDVSKPLSANDLGINFDGNAKLLPDLIYLQEKYYIFDIDASLRNVNVQVSLSAGEGTSLKSTATFLTITNFEQAFDLRNLAPLSPLGSDKSFASIISQANAVSGSEITSVLENLIEKYVNAQVPGLQRDFDYTINNIETIDGGVVTFDNLQDNARTYKASISAKLGTKISNQTTLKISFPKLNLYDLSKFPSNVNCQDDNWKVDDPANVTSSYVIKNLKTKILTIIHETNPDVTWDDLYATFSLSETSNMPPIINLTMPYLSIEINLSSLPYSQHAFNKQIITVILPSITG